jgi:hypothetical protein
MPGKFNVCRDNLYWKIHFHPDHSNGLLVGIQELWALPTMPMSKGPELRHIFQRPYVPTEENLVKWSQAQMGAEPEDRFQNALDGFISGCCRSRFSHLEVGTCPKIPHSIQKVPCWTQTWLTRAHVCVDHPPEQGA